MSELSHQIRCANYLNTLPSTVIDGRLVWTHPPNGGKRANNSGREMNQSGTRRGVPDILIFESPPTHPQYVGAALELKAPGGKTSTEQEHWLEFLAACGWYTAVREGSRAMKQLIRELGYDA